jgi:DnaJ-class molecular chaperone
MSLCCGRGCATCAGDGAMEAVSCYRCKGSGALPARNG